MTKQEDGSVEIYIGSRIQHISEQRVLEHLVSLLAELKRDAIILANVNLEGHQLDLILALNDLTLLIEVKGYTRPVSGKANGAWQVLLASGKTKNAVNAYQQALNATYALRDVMRAFHDADVDYYPQAAVVFVPKTHPQSSIFPGDHKVSLINMSDLEELVRQRQKGCWKIPAWRAFALHHNLHPIADVQAACDAAMFEAERSITAYLAEFCRTYAPTTETIVKFSCTSDGDSVGSEDVVCQIEKGCDALILGPSGCGKTLLAYSAGVAHARARGVPIIVSAKHFEGRFREILDREVGLMARCSAADLLAMARQLNLPTILIVDGYNECEAQHRVALTRGISAISNHFQMGVLITSQSNPLRLDLLPALRPYLVPATERTVKVAIASKAMRGAALSTAMESLIDLVGSGLEASLIGEVGLEVSSGVSRHALFDAYARKRLGALAMDGIRALSVIADYLVARVALSLSVRDLDRVSETQGVPARLVGDLTDAGLLAQRGNRMSFAHEQFFCAFAAESVLRRAAGSPEAITSALASPRYADLKEFIVGAIDDEILLLQVLAQVSDVSILDACLCGRCGARAKEWAHSQMSHVLTRMRREVECVKFLVNGDSWFAVERDPERLLTWSKQDDAFVECLPPQIVQGCYLQDVFDVVEALDHRIEEEIRRLRQQEAPPKNLRSSIFGACYGLGRTNSLRISRVCVAAHSRPFDITTEGVIQDLHRLRDRELLSAGVLYLLISLYRGLPSDDRASEVSAIAEFYSSIITARWRSLPYHLKLAIIDGARYCRNAEEPALSALATSVETLLSNDNPFLNSMLFDVLQALRPFGADEEAHEAAVRNQVAQLLSSPEDPLVCEEAYAIYNCQFDHPYSNAYCAALNGLGHHQRRSFLTRAVKGASDVGMFLSCLIREASALSDSSINPALGRWTALPERNQTSPQEAMEVFAVAHVFLGRLGGELPPVEMTGDDPAADCLRACGLILYWNNRKDIEDTERQLACRAGWDVLSRHAVNAALTAVKDCAEFMMWASPHGRAETSLLSYAPSKVAELCRDALKRPDTQLSYFPHFSHQHSADVLSYAIKVLSRHGNIADLSLLQQFVDHAELGRVAIAAIHALTEHRES